VVSDLPLAQAKTRLLAKALGQLGINGTALLVVGEGRSAVVQAAKNMPSLTVVKPEELNVYDVVRCRSIIIPERELARVKEAWS
jgi:large subunit ribosomal protein L4